MATGGMFLPRELEQVLVGVLERKYRNLFFEDGTVVPTMQDLQPGANEVLREFMDQVGAAEVLADGAWDVPIIGISKGEERYPVRMIASAFERTFHMSRALQFTGDTTPIGIRSANLAGRSIAERVNRYTAYGATTLGETGFVNNGDVTLNNSSFNPYTATPSELVDFFMDQLATIAADTSTVFGYSSKLLLSVQLDLLLSRRIMPDSGLTVKRHLTQEIMYITEIQAVPELNHTFLEANGVLSSGTNKDRMVFYPFDPEVNERHIESLQVMPEEWWGKQGGRHIIPLFQCVTPAINNFPVSMLYVDVIKNPSVA